MDVAHLGISFLYILICSGIYIWDMDYRDNWRWAVDTDKVECVYMEDSGSMVKDLDKCTIYIHR